MSENKYYLNCPYSEELMQTLGAKWDKDKKVVCSEGVDRKKFKKMGN